MEQATYRLAARDRLPTMFAPSRVDVGGLISYGTCQVESIRRMTTYVDKVLKGAGPGELSVETVTRYELIVNLKTAQEIGVTIPPGVLTNPAWEEVLAMKVMEPQDMDAAFEEAYNSGDIERLMALYEPDAVMAPSPGKRAVGHFAIRDVLLRLLAFNGRMTCRNLYCMRVDRIALLQAEWKLSGTRPDGNPVEMSSRTAEVVRQQEDSSWRYLIDHAFASD